MPVERLQRAAGAVGVVQVAVDHLGHLSGLGVHDDEHRRGAEVVEDRALEPLVDLDGKADVHGWPPLLCAYAQYIPERWLSRMELGRMPPSAADEESGSWPTTSGKRTTPVAGASSSRSFRAGSRAAPSRSGAGRALRAGAGGGGGRSRSEARDGGRRPPPALEGEVEGLQVDPGLPDDREGRRDPSPWSPRTPCIRRPPSPTSPSRWCRPRGRGGPWRSGRRASRTTPGA